LGVFLREAKSQQKERDYLKFVVSQAATHPYKDIDKDIKKMLQIKPQQTNKKPEQATATSDFIRFAKAMGKVK